jgi:hypothetical protein
MAMPTYALAVTEIPVGRQHFAAVEPAQTLSVGMVMPTYALAVKDIPVGRQHFAAAEPSETKSVGMVMPTYTLAVKDIPVGRQHFAAVTFMPPETPARSPRGPGPCGTVPRAPATCRC